MVRYNAQSMKDVQIPFLSQFGEWGGVLGGQVLGQDGVRLNICAVFIPKNEIEGDSLEEFLWCLCF